MITRVARAFGQDWWTQCRQPFHQTLRAYWALEDAERIDALLTEHRAQEAAHRTALAFHRPSELHVLDTRLRMRLAAHPHEAPAEPLWRRAAAIQAALTAAAVVRREQVH